MKKEERLGTAPLPKLILSLAMPSVFAQLINVLYNIVDRIYIGHIPGIGHIALTGVGVTFPILMLISAFSAFIGMGGAPLASIKLGENDRAGAEKILGNGLTVLICFSVVLTTVFFLFKEPLLFLFGASNESYPYANEYISIYLTGTIFVQLSLGLNPFIGAQGFAKTGMFSVLIGAITNIILDPIFIFGFGMGVRGAALATVLSQAISALWVVAFLCSKRTILKIRRHNLRPDFGVVKKIAMLGISPFIMQSTESLINIVLNSSLQHYGNDLYVGSMTIMTSVMQLIVVPIDGLTQGVQPVISYNFGAGKLERVKKTFRIMIFTTTIVATICCIAVILFPRAFASLFTQSTDLLELTGRMMPIYVAGIWAYGAQKGCQGTFLALGQAKISVFIAMLRKVFLLTPLALVLPAFFGVESIYFSEPIADTIAATTTVTLFLLNYKRILYSRKNGKSKPRKG